MLFDVLHETRYRYEEPAVEAYAECRLRPPQLPRQEIRDFTLETEPGARAVEYADAFENSVHFFSIPRRHRELDLRSRFFAKTTTGELPAENLDVPVGEARQILNSRLVDIFHYLKATETTSAAGAARQWARKYFPAQKPLGKAVEELSAAIHEHFTYESGATTVSTPLAQVWKQRRGVCQDFAHVMLSILRASRMPCRYVCGYIETDPPEDAGGAGLVGAVATHAWVEVLLPGEQWAGIDPTNNQWAGERHIVAARGRDFRDAAPVRGIFKGAPEQEITVRVQVRRLE